MPPKGAAQRAEQAAAVAAGVHAAATDPRIPDWIAAAGAAGRGRRRSTSPRRRACTAARCGCRRGSRPSSPRPRSRAQTAWEAAREAERRRRPSRRSSRASWR